MNLLTELYNTYNLSEENGLIDKHREGETVLLPLYHNNMNSTGDNIIIAHLNRDGTLERAEFVPKDQSIIFPVNESSVTRTSNISAHPLVDNLGYIVPKETKKNKDYIEKFSHWYNFLSDADENKLYLKIIKTFIFQENMIEQLVQSLYGDTNFELNDLKLEYEVSSEKKKKTKKIDLSKVFLTFSINEFVGLKNSDVTTNVNLHNSYIDYINSSLDSNGVCLISGEEAYLSSNHRGLLGNAKLVSVSNKKETYFGRFQKGSDIFKMGYQSSEKIHLMLKYLLENQNSYKWMGEKQFLVNWLSTDISNDSQLDVLNSQTKPLTLFGEEEREVDEDYIPVNIRTKDIGDAFKRGNKIIPRDTNYYASIIDRSSKGRISVKYFRKLPVSQLLQNLENWQSNNSWETYDFDSQMRIEKTPSATDIIFTTYGIERDGKFELDNVSFKKDQYQTITMCIIDGLPIPKNYLKKLDINIRQRLNYPKKWRQLMHVAYSLLNNQKEGKFNTMVDKANTNRSYLFGRLLALYELIESNTFDENTRRVTSAEKFWSSFTNNPENIMQVLEDKIKPYEQKLRLSKPGLHHKIQKEKQEIMTMLDENTDASNANKRLTYQFIYGYYSEIKFVYTKKEEEVTHD